MQEVEGTPPGRSPGGGNGNPSRIPAWRIPRTPGLAGHSPWGRTEWGSTECTRIEECGLLSSFFPQKQGCCCLSSAGWEASPLCSVEKGLRVCVAGLSISPSNEYSGLISFRMDWFALLPIQGTLKSLLQQFKKFKASILLHSAYFTVHLSHPYMTTGKTIALTRQTFVGKVMSLLFNMLSSLVIAFLPSSVF